MPLPALAWLPLSPFLQRGSFGQEGHLLLQGSLSILNRIFIETKWMLLESPLFIYLSWGDPWGKYRKSSGIAPFVARKKTEAHTQKTIFVTLPISYVVAMQRRKISQNDKGRSLLSMEVSLQCYYTKSAARIAPCLSCNRHIRLEFFGRGFRVTAMRSVTKSEHGHGAAAEPRQLKQERETTEAEGGSVGSAQDLMDEIRKY
eukprot:scaffold3538_cov86-Skeletonema_dohrnii-CCMP3373.AAC.6